MNALTILFLIVPSIIASKDQKHDTATPEGRFLNTHPLTYPGLTYPSSHYYPGQYLPTLPSWSGGFFVDRCNYGTCAECAQHGCEWHTAGGSPFHKPYCSRSCQDSTCLSLGQQQTPGTYTCPKCSIYEGTCDQCDTCEDCSNSGGCAWHTPGGNPFHGAFCAHYCLLDNTCIPTDSIGSTTYTCPSREPEPCKYPNCDGCEDCNDCKNSGGCAWHVAGPLGNPTHGAFCANYCLLDGTCIPADINGDYDCLVQDVCDHKTCDKCQSDDHCVWNQARGRDSFCMEKTACHGNPRCLEPLEKCPPIIEINPLCKWPFCDGCKDCDHCVDAGCAYHTAGAGHGAQCMHICLTDGTCLGINDKCPPEITTLYPRPWDWWNQWICKHQ